MSTVTISALRAALRAQFGARQYRITQDGDIHVRGTMPNTGQTGWYLYGYVGARETEQRLGLVQ